MARVYILSLSSCLAHMILKVDLLSLTLSLLLHVYMCTCHVVWEKGLDRKVMNLHVQFVEDYCT